MAEIYFHHIMYGRHPCDYFLFFGESGLCICKQIPKCHTHARMLCDLNDEISNVLDVFTNLRIVAAIDCAPKIAKQTALSIDWAKMELSNSFVGKIYIITREEFWIAQGIVFETINRSFAKQDCEAAWRRIIPTRCKHIVVRFYRGTHSIAHG